MLEQSHSHFLASQERARALREHAANVAVVRAIRAEKRRAAIAAILRTLTAELQELELRTDTAWRARHEERAAHSRGRLQQVR